MTDIRELDERTVERIAAGEVVERPASVVKELVENGLDADASRVRVAVEAGGKDGIRVSDDGVGMTEEEVRLAVREHTTSKIRDVSDLEAGVDTLGFRGEALHAIGAVSRTTIRTRPRGGDRGTELRVEGGEVTAVEPAGCPEGTTVEVADLFYNVPARRKYLKQDGTEFAHVNTVVAGYALANPDVRVTLEHDGRETFATTGSGDLRAAVMAVYGREVAESMVPVAAGDADDPGIGTDDPEALPDGPLDGVAGLVSHPETTRSGREYLSTYVNGRYVTAGAVREAVVDAYGAQLAPDRYPFAVLFLSVAGEAVDVNVHPRKREVRFADEEGVRRQVRSAVEDALLDAGLVRSSAPRGRSAPEQAEIAPGEDGAADDAGGTGTASGADDAGGPGTSGGSDEIDGADGSDGTDGTDGTGDDPTPASARPPVDDTPGPTAGQGGSSGESGGSEPGTTAASSAGKDATTGSDATVSRGAESAATTGGRAGSTPPEDGGGGGRGAGHRPDPVDAGRPDRRDPHDRDRTRSQPVDTTAQARLDSGTVDEVREFENLPSMRLLGQFRETYLVAESDDGLVLVDQHAADERVNYERLRERLAGGTRTQALAEPVVLELTAREAALFAEYEDALASLGFHARLVDGGEDSGADDSAGSGAADGAPDRTGDGRHVEVSTVPALVAEAAGPELVRDVLSAFVAGEAAAAETVDAAADAVLADLACYPAVTANTSLSAGSVLDLLSALDDCENPYACPHGRPVIIELSADEIEDRFERDYPGHGGRRG